MFSLILSSLIISAEPNQPTEVIGSAATPDGERHNITVFQPNNQENPFGYIAPEQYIPPKLIGNTPSLPETSSATTGTPKEPIQLVTQTSTTNPLEMNQNPLAYQNKIENTIYQSGNRLIDIQSVPIKDINTALTPNIQPTISDYPSW
jgi:hypothetical protein